MTIRSYTELSDIPDLTGRFRYLQLGSRIGVSVFGYDRYLNQRFYTSVEWRHVRNHVIARDQGCDLGLPDWPISDQVHIHHMNPMTVDDVVHGRGWIVDPEYLITVSRTTHNAIHFGDESLLPRPMIVRRPGDTDLW
jgi:hypothetical protein